MRTFEIVADADGSVVGFGAEFVVPSGRPCVAVCHNGRFGPDWPVIYTQADDLAVALPNTSLRWAE